MQRSHRINNFLSEVLSHTDNLYENVFLDLNGSIIADGVEGKSIGYKLHESAALSGQRAIQENTTVIADPQKSPITQRQVIIISPIKKANKQQQAVGIVRSAVDLRTVADAILLSDNTKVNNGAKIYLVDKAGVVLSSNDESAILTLDFSSNAQLTSFHSAMQQQNSAIGNITIESISYKATAAKTKQSDFWLVSMTPTKVYQQKIISLRNDIIVLMLIASLLCVCGIQYY